MISMVMKFSLIYHFWTDYMINEIIYFTAGLLIGVFRKQIVAYIKKQQELQKLKRNPPKIIEGN